MRVFEMLGAEVFLYLTVDGFDVTCREHPSTKAKPGDNVLDIGTGTGVIPILMAAKTKPDILPVLRYSMRVRIWRCEAFGIIIWKSESLL